MRAEKWDSVKGLFEAALARPAAEREAFVREAAGGDVSLMAEVESLLAAHGEAGAFLEPVQPSPGEEVARSAAGALVGRRIGAYTLLRVLGHGGMGTVYEAEQESPRRRVALKIVRGEGSVDDRVERLFRREVQALALLNHPHIAALYEAGHTDDGQHYFAMELVKGEPVTRFAVSRQLSTQQRLTLFAQVCDGIAYAHQRGVIHRDLKPSNVLVVAKEVTKLRSDEVTKSGSRGSNAYDHIGQPKVLDFGLARITNADVSLTTMTADVGRIEGTLAYMSPEQARGRSEEIDLRSDIYSLGVMLYELITDALPYDVRTLPLPHAVRRICDETPTRPSAINREVKGDLETIVLKALEKEPGRRYQSAGELARDVRHFLAAEPIEAKRDSAWYVLRKQMRRHRLAFGVAGAFVLLLMGSTVVATTLYARAERSAQLAREQQARAERSTEEALEEKARAERLAAEAQRSEKEARHEQSRANASLSFLERIITGSLPTVARGRDVTLRELLDEAGEEIDATAQREPLIAANMHTLVGRTYMDLGMFEESRRHFESALALRREKLGERDETVANCLHDLGMLSARSGDYPTACKQFAAALELQLELLGPEHLSVARTMQSLAPCYRNAEPAKAEEYVQRALEIRRNELGMEHLDVAESLELLAIFCNDEGRHDDALALDEEALRIRRALLAPNTPAVKSSLTNMGLTLRRLGRLEESEKCQREALAIGREVLPEKHPSLASTLNNLAGVLTAQMKFDEAAALYEEALEIWREAYGERHLEVGRTLNNLGALYLSQEEAAKAEPLYRAAAEIFREHRGASALIAAPLLGLGKSLRRLGRTEEAEPVLREALGMLERGAKPEDAWRLVEANCEIGRILTARGEYAEAEGFLLRAQALNEQVERADKKTDEPIRALVKLYEVWERSTELAWWMNKLPPQVPTNDSAP